MFNSWYEPYFGYIYKTVLPDGRLYIGQKKSNKIVASYYGSGKHLENWFLKNLGFSSKNCPEDIADNHGVHREILDYALDQDELNFLEIHYIYYAKQNDVFNECLNMHSGGTGTFYKPPGKFIITKESIEKAKETKRKRRELGLYVCTDETRRKRSEGIKAARKLKPAWNKGLTKDTDSRILSMSEKAKSKHIKYSDDRKKQMSENTKGTRWWNNGSEQVRSKDCPPGFTRGMLDWKGDKKIVFTEEHRQHIKDSWRSRKNGQCKNK